MPHRAIISAASIRLVGAGILCVEIWTFAKILPSLTIIVQCLYSRLTERRWATLIDNQETSSRTVLGSESSELNAVAADPLGLG